MHMSNYMSSHIKCNVKWNVILADRYTTTLNSLTGSTANKNGLKLFQSIQDK